MRRSVEWHEHVIQNMKVSLAAEEKKAESIMQRIDRLKFDIAIRAAQIVRARAEGKTAFDSDVFNKPRKKARSHE